MYLYIYIFIYIYVCIDVYIYVYIYMIPVSGPVAPPQWYGPLLPDQNLSFPWYLQHFGCKTSYYLYYLQELKSIVILPLYYLYYLQDPPTSHIHRLEGGTMTMGWRLYTPNWGGTLYTPNSHSQGRGGEP